MPFDKNGSHPAALKTSQYGASMKELLKANINREILLMKRNSFVYIFKATQVMILKAKIYKKFNTNWFRCYFYISIQEHNIHYLIISLYSSVDNHGDHRNDRLSAHQYASWLGDRWRDIHGCSLLWDFDDHVQWFSRSRSNYCKAPCFFQATESSLLSSMDIHVAIMAN